MKKKKKSSRKGAIVSICIIGLLMVVVSFFAFNSFSFGEDKLYRYNSFIDQIKLGIDLKGGVYCVMEVIPNDGISEDNLKDNINGAIKIIQDRLTAKGYSEATVQLQTNTLSTTTTYKVRIEVPDVEDPDELFSIIGKPAVLQFKSPDGDVIISGSHVKTAYASYDENGKPAVQLELTDEGKKKFADATAKYVNQAISIVLDGKTISSPTVNAAITNGKPVITGSYTTQQAMDFATQIQSGALQVKFKEVNPSIISAKLGQNAIRSGLLAGAIGLALILIFMYVIYRGLGLAADIALLIYILLLIFFMAVLPIVQLTLPGIAGLILGIGMAVDGNIIIFERIKDEYRVGKTLKASIDYGFKRARVAIIDANLTTMIAAVVLYLLGTGPIQGFALTLGLSIILSVVTSLFVTKFLLNKFFAIGDKNLKFYNLNKIEREVDVNV